VNKEARAAAYALCNATDGTATKANTASFSFSASCVSFFLFLQFELYCRDGGSEGGVEGRVRTSLASQVNNNSLLLM